MKCQSFLLITTRNNKNHEKHYKQLEKLCKGQGVKNSAFKLIQLFKYGSRKLEGVTEIT